MTFRDISFGLFVALVLLCIGCGKESSPPPRTKRTVNFDQLREGTKVKPDELRRLYQRHNIPPADIIEDTDEPLRMIRWADGDFTLWRVTYSSRSDDRRYLIFRKQRDDEVKYLADVMFTSYRSPPQVDFLPMQNGGLLALRWESSYESGTGGQNYRDSWYRVTEGQAEKILDVPSKGQVSRWGSAVNRRYKSRLAVIFEGNRFEGIGYRYRVAYRPDSEDLISSTEPLRSTLTQYWRWDGDTHELVLDRNLSSATPAQVQAIFQNGPDGFVEDNLYLLKRMKLTPQRRRWMLQLADNCVHDSNKMTLHRLLRQPETNDLTSQQNVVMDPSEPPSRHTLAEAREIIARHQQALFDTIVHGNQERRKSETSFEDAYRQEVRTRLRNIAQNIAPSAIHWVDVDEDDIPDLIFWTEGLARSASDMNEYLFIVKRHEDGSSEVLKTHLLDPTPSRRLLEYWHCAFWAYPNRYSGCNGELRALMSYARFGASGSTFVNLEISRNMHDSKIHIDKTLTSFPVAVYPKID